ncbi:hypothetical protein [uncultured Psychrobacter sp.]|uniref:hypothetical protein n=1 Tax=uncultured Psychrobacter sp. TaxID=259303 RepID=UPI0026199B42|nr:hypothetical protein [uncultured Psychrobacter sp.]
MAQALFKGWFVDFDPVIDNALLADKAIPKLLKERLGMCQARLDSGKTNTNSEINVLFPKTPGAVVVTQLGLDAEYVGLIDELSVSII